MLSYRYKDAGTYRSEWVRNAVLQKRVGRRGITEWVIFKIKLEVTGQALSPLIKIPPINNHFFNSLHALS